MQKYSTAGRLVELPSMKAKKFVSDVSVDKSQQNANEYNT